MYNIMPYTVKTYLAERISIMKLSLLPLRNRASAAVMRYHACQLSYCTCHIAYL